MLVEIKGFVSNNDSPETKTQLEIVYNRERLRMEAQLKFVNINKEGLKMENHFEDELVQRYVPIWSYGLLDIKNEVSKLNRIDWLGIQ